MKVTPVSAVKMGLIISIGIGIVIGFYSSTSGEGGGDEAAQKVLDKMTQSRKIDYGTMSKVVAPEVLVMGAKPEDEGISHDQVQSVLKVLKIPFTPITEKEVEDYDFKEAVVLLINCREPALSGKAQDKIKDFLAKGGYLFTTDWCVDSVVNRVSPGYIKSAGMGTEQGKDTVNIHPSEKNKDHIFLRDVFPKEMSDFKWVLDQGFKYFKVTRPEAVTVLIEAEEKMTRKYRNNVLAVCWSSGGDKGYNPKFAGYKGEADDYVSTRSKTGVILHVASHFNMQGLGLNDVAGNSSMYQLLANFIVDAKLAKQNRKAKK